MKLSIWLVAAVIGLGANFAAASETVVVDRSMSEQEVLDAQQGWCKALLDIGNVHTKEGHAAAKALAGQVIDGAYAYQMGAVLFKPTLTVNPQTFRTTRDGALSYFVGGDSAFPNDDGFALKGWKKCEIENAAIFITGDSATTMGESAFYRQGRKQDLGRQDLGVRQRRLGNAENRHAPFVAGVSALEIGPGRAGRSNEQGCAAKTD